MVGEPFCKPAIPDDAQEINSAHKRNVHAAFCQQAACKSGQVPLFQSPRHSCFGGRLRARTGSLAELEPLFGHHGLNQAAMPAFSAARPWNPTRRPPTRPGESPEPLLAFERRQCTMGSCS